MNLTGSRAFITGSVALSVISLVLPTFCQPTSPCNLGIGDLLLGWLGLLTVADSPANLAWLANIALIASWGFCSERMRRSGITASLLAIGLAVLPLITREVAVDEAGWPRPIAGFGSGYVAWIGGMVAAFIASCLIARRRPEI